MIKKLLSSLLMLILGSSVLISCASPKVKSEHISDVQFLMQKKTEIYDGFLKELDRVDANRLVILKNKDVSWTKIASSLRSEVEKAKTPADIGAVFKKLDAVYPHVQSQFFLNPDLDRIPLGSKLILPIRITPTVEQPGQQHFKYFISHVKSELFNGMQAPIEGDEILEINKKPMADWEAENFIFCKYTSKVLCALELGHNLRNENLSWDHHSPLMMIVQRGPQKIVINVKTSIQAGGDFETSDVTGEGFNEALPCGVDVKKRYPSFGFLYKGRKLCLLESHSYPGVALLRIVNFNYFGTESIRTIKQEVEIFSKFYWNEHSGEIKHLIIDLMDNEGGEEPISYYSIFFDRPFEDRYIKYKKIKEWDEPDFDESIFTGENEAGKLIWMKALREEGIYNKIAVGHFFDPVPRACVNSKLDCRVGRFEPAEHQFKGDVQVMLNQNCILGCSSFAANLEKYLGARVSFYGLPDSGDPAAAQLELKLFLTPDASQPFEVRTQIWNASTPPFVSDLLFAQTVAFSEATDEKGVSEAGVNRKITKMAKLNYKNYPGSYTSETLKLILNELRKK